MANDEHVAVLKQGVTAWNAWRRENANNIPDLSWADLREANLHGADLVEANLYMANLEGGDLSEANLRSANLIGAKLNKANLSGAHLVEAKCRADFSGADLRQAILHWATLIGANLRHANLSGADLMEARLGGLDPYDRVDLVGADLSGAKLMGADLNGADLSRANLIGADLRGAAMLDANLTGADLTGCRIHGVSAWDLKLEGAKQQNLVITQSDDPEITVDNIEVAQFIYLMLNNQNIRGVIDAITSKAVLILGRFTDERKAVLDALRDELRKRNYLPVLFDFAVLATRDITETVSLLARMARFIIADLTDPSSIPKELEAIVPSLAVPVQPLLEGSSRPYAMFKDYWKYDWVLPIHWYQGLEPLVATLAEKVIAPAEAKVNTLAERRRMIEAELTKPQIGGP
jgi:uncharacterized protein YjbI with pentapeptide repeats